MLLLFVCLYVCMYVTPKTVKVRSFFWGGGGLRPKLVMLLLIRLFVQIQDFRVLLAKQKHFFIAFKNDHNVYIHMYVGIICEQRHRC
jgi:hypothetical protein